MTRSRASRPCKIACASARPAAAVESDDRPTGSAFLISLGATKRWRRRTRVFSNGRAARVRADFFLGMAQMEVDRTLSPRRRRGAIRDLRKGFPRGPAEAKFRECP